MTADEVLKQPWVTGAASDAPLDSVQKSLRKYNATRKAATSARARDPRSLRLTQLNRVPIVALAWKLCIAAHSVRSCHQ